MKTSDKILIYLVFTVVFAIAVMVVTSRFIIIQQNLAPEQNKLSETGLITKDYPVENFSGISVSGGWEVDISKSSGNEYQVQITLPKTESDNIDIYKLNDQLNIKYKNGLFDGNDYSLGTHKIKITLPILSRIELSGGTETIFSGFQSDRMAVIISGSSKLIGRGNSIGNLSVNCSGASKMELGESIVTNADLQISGASSIDLKMAGGELTGNASGVVTILYSGNIRMQDIHQSGIVTIVKR